MKVAVMGAGSVGCYFGGLLALYGRLAARNPIGKR